MGFGLQFGIPAYTTVNLVQIFISAAADNRITATGDNRVTAIGDNRVIAAP